MTQKVPFSHNADGPIADIQPTAVAPASVSVVVPVYNGALTVPTLVSGLRQTLSAIGASYEIILVNDGSRDDSWDAIYRCASQFREVRGINLMRNYGQHNALLAGIRAATHDVIVTLDDDLQHPPEQIPVLLVELDRGFDVVYGTPLEEQHVFWRDLASRITKLALQSAMGAETARKVSAFRAFRTPVRNAFASYQGPFVSLDVLLTWGSIRFAAVAVEHRPREVGVSNYTFRKLVIHALNMMTGFSTLPLQLASVLGFGSTLLGLVFLVYVLGRYAVEGGSVPGFPFLASTIAIFSGAQMFALGIIGEYLARMHFRLMDRPSYAVRETTRPGDADSD